MTTPLVRVYPLTIFDPLHIQLATRRKILYINLIRGTFARTRDMIVRCQGRTRSGNRCKINSTAGSPSGTELDKKFYDIAQPLRNGMKFCTYHNSVQCMGATLSKRRCRIFSNTSNPDLKEVSEPLRRGEKYCALHAFQEKKKKPTNVNRVSRGKCTICLDNIYDDDIKFLRCIHMFHNKCIDTWLVRSNKCPNCNQPAFDASSCSSDTED